MGLDIVNCFDIPDSKLCSFLDVDISYAVVCGYFRFGRSEFGSLLDVDISDSDVLNLAVSWIWIF